MIFKTPVRTGFETPEELAKHRLAGIAAGNMFATAGLTIGEKLALETAANKPNSVAGQLTIQGHWGVLTKPW